MAVWIRLLVLAGLLAILMWQWRDQAVPPVAVPTRPPREAPVAPSSTPPPPRATIPERHSGNQEETVTAVLRQADTTGDRKRVIVLLNDLVKRGRAGDDGAVRAVLDLLAEFPLEKQRYLLQALARMATPAALAALLEVADATNPRLGSIRREALDAVRTIGRQTDDQGNFPLALSSPLEALLPAALADREKLGAISDALASVGSPSGIEALLRVAEQQPDSDISRQIGAALKRVRNPEAVSPLASRLRADPGLSGESSRMAAQALADMSSGESTAALLEWATEAEGEEAVEDGRRLFSGLRDPQSLTLVNQATQGSVFKNPRMAAMVKEVAESLNAAARPQIDID